MIYFLCLFFLSNRAQRPHTAETSFHSRSALICHQVSDKIGFCLLLQTTGLSNKSYCLRKSVTPCSLSPHFIREISTLNSPTGLLSSNQANLLGCSAILSEGAVRKNLISRPLANQQTLAHFLVWLAKYRRHLCGRKKKKSHPAPLASPSVV